MKPKKRQIRCAMCDAWYYEDDAEEAKVHLHPEPQSGAFRYAWSQSQLPYDRWIKETEMGRAWERSYSKKGGE